MKFIFNFSRRQISNYQAARIACHLPFGDREISLQLQ